MIQSVDNPKVKYLMKLSQAKYRKAEKKYLVEGAHLVQEAKTAGVLEEAFSLVEKEGFTQVSEAVMKKICHTDSVVPEMALCRQTESTIKTDRILILDAIQDPGNMGTLMRSAVAFGFDTIFVGDGCVDIYNDKVVRASQGAIFKLHFWSGNIVSFLQKIPEYQTYGTNVERGMPLEKIQPQPKMALILGNEGNGISKDIHQLGLPNIYLPMKNTESLNVAVAGSIIMYELGRQ